MSTELLGLSERWYQAWLEKDATTDVREARGARICTASLDEGTLIDGCL
jgi:hypothetical protein